MEPLVEMIGMEEILVLY